MIKKKICLLGYFAVGKTSLVKRFVHETFSEKYHTTIGVKIDKKEIVVNDINYQLLIWDIHGEDKFQKVQKSYFMGTSGYFLVVDATRKESLQAVVDLQALVESTIGKVPFVILLNKTDLVDRIELGPDDIKAEGFNDCFIIETSAKTGEKVEFAFKKLVAEF